MTKPTELAQLRRLYQNMVNGAVRDTASAKRIADDLLAPVIKQLEREQAQGAALRKSISAEATCAVMQADFEQRQRLAITGEHDD